MTYFFQDTEKVIDTFNVVPDEVNYYVHKHYGQKLIQLGQNLVMFKNRV